MENNERQEKGSPQDVSSLFRDEEDGILKYHIAAKEAGSMKNPKPIWIDFIKLLEDFHRPEEMRLRKTSHFYKALGGKETHTVLDTSCGMGKDSMRMLSYGYKVIACERSPLVFALLQDAYKRALLSSSKNFSELFAKGFELYEGDAAHYIKEKGLDEIDTIYLDPMYGEKNKKGRSALSRKEMQVFHHLVGEDSDAEELLALVLEKSHKSQRIVVKRPSASLGLSEKLASYLVHRYAGKSTAFDMYKKL